MGFMEDMAEISKETKNEKKPEEKELEVNAEDSKVEEAEKKEEVEKKVEKPKGETVAEPKAEKPKEEVKAEEVLLNDEREVEIPEGYISKEEYDTLKDEMELLSNDPLMKELIDLRKKGKSITKELLRDGFEDYEAIDLANLGTAKHWVKQSLLANGLSEREADITLKKQFKLIGQADEDLSEDEIEERDYQEVQLSTKAKEFLKTKKESQARLKDIDTTSTNKDDVEREIARQRDEFVQTQANNLKNIAVNVTDKVMKVEYEATYKSGEEEVKVPYQIEITAEMKKHIRKELQDPAVLNFVYRDVNKSESSENQIKAVMSNAVKFLYPELNTQLSISQALSSAEKNWINNDLTHRNKQPPSGSGKNHVAQPPSNSAFLKGIADAIAENT